MIRRKRRPPKNAATETREVSNENAPSHANTETTITGAVGNAIVARANRSLSDAATLAFMRAATAAPATTIHVRRAPVCHLQVVSRGALSHPLNLRCRFFLFRTSNSHTNESSSFVQRHLHHSRSAIDTFSLPSELPEMHNKAMAPAVLSSTLPSSDDNDLRTPFGDHATTNHAAFSLFSCPPSSAIATHVDEDNINDDSLNSDETIVPIAQMSQSIFVAPVISGAVVDPSHASTESLVANGRAAAAFESRDSTKDPFVTAGRHRPLANPAFSAASSFDSSAAFGLRAGPDTLPTLRGPVQAHTAQRGHRRLGDQVTGR